MSLLIAKVVMATQMMILKLARRITRERGAFHDCKEIVPQSSFVALENLRKQKQ